MTAPAQPATEPATVVLSEWESIQRLGPDLPVPGLALTSNAAEAVEACVRFGGRVVLKASGIAHKSELGLVRVGLDVDGVADAWDELADAGDGTVLCCEMVSGDLELIVGGLRDPHFGAVVTIGIGGIATEVFADAVTILSPPEPGEVQRSLALLRAADLLHGHRGSTPVDLARLETVVQAVADLLDADPRVVEVDCNPVLISDGQPLALDALVVLEQP